MTRRLDFYALVAATAVSSLGNVVAAIAIPWLVLTTTGSAAKTGVAAFATTLPLALGAFFGGTVVDRVGARAASIGGDIAAATAIAAIPLLHALGALHLWSLLVLAFAGGIFDAPSQAARLALLPELARRTEMPLERANALLLGTEHVGYVLGAPLAGLLIATLGAPTALCLDAASFAGSAAVVASAVRVPAPRAMTRRRYVEELVEGLRFVARDPLIRLLLVLPAVGTFLISPLASVVLPVLARREFGGASDYALMMACYGVGGLAGAGLFALSAGRISRRCLFVSIWLGYPPLGIVLALLPPLWAVLAALALIGIAAGAIVPLEHTVRQELTPKHLRGRVFATVAASQAAAVPLGVLLGGAVVQALGLRAELVLYGAGNVVLAVAAVTAPAGRRLTAGRASIPRPARAEASSPRSR
jgi:MFS family permease